MLMTQTSFFKIIFLQIFTTACNCTNKYIKHYLTTGIQLYTKTIYSLNDNLVKVGVRENTNYLVCSFMKAANNQSAKGFNMINDIKGKYVSDTNKVFILT